MEFTGLHQKTTLISIGIVSDCGKCFYAELNDYNGSQVNDWIRDNVIVNLGKIKDNWNAKDRRPKCIAIGNTEYVRRNELLEWLDQFGEVEMWSDVLAYDWVLLNALLADYSEGYPKLPSNIYYIPFDISTLFKLKGIDPDVNREEFIDLLSDDMPDYLSTFSELLELEKATIIKHNALWDALVIKHCYTKAVSLTYVSRVDD